MRKSNASGFFLNPLLSPFLQFHFCKIQPFSFSSLQDAPVCYGCGNRIVSGQMLGIQDKKFHPQCFRCAQCQATIQVWSLNFQKLLKTLLLKNNIFTGWGLSSWKSVHVPKLCNGSTTSNLFHLFFLFFLFPTFFEAFKKKNLFSNFQIIQAWCEWPCRRTSSRSRWPRGSSTRRSTSRRSRRSCCCRRGCPI